MSCHSGLLQKLNPKLMNFVVPSNVTPVQSKSVCCSAPFRILMLLHISIQKSVSCCLTAVSSDWLNLSVSAQLDLRETGLCVKVTTA